MRANERRLRDQARESGAIGAVRSGGRALEPARNERQCEGRSDPRDSCLISRARPSTSAPSALNPHSCTAVPRSWASCDPSPPAPARWTQSSASLTDCTPRDEPEPRGIAPPGLRQCLHQCGLPAPRVCASSMAAALKRSPRAASTLHVDDTSRATSVGAQVVQGNHSSGPGSS